jgi:hypothetical protein
MTNTDVRYYNKNDFYCWSCTLPIINYSYFDKSTNDDSTVGDTLLVPPPSKTKGNLAKLLCFNARSIKM